jgi:hypothetical protein
LAAEPTPAAEPIATPPAETETESRQLMLFTTAPLRDDRRDRWA